MKATPTQIRALSDLLAEPADSVTELAERVWARVWELSMTRERHVLVAFHPEHNVLEVVGPYATDNQARKDAVNRIVQTGGTQVRVAHLYDPSKIDPATGGRI